MDADVFFSSKVLKLVGTSVTYDLGHDRMWESAGTRQQTFFIKEHQSDNWDCSCQPSVKRNNLYHICHCKREIKPHSAKNCNYTHVYEAIVPIAGQSMSPSPPPTYLTTFTPLRHA